MWQVEQNSGVRMNGFMNVWRWRDGSIRMRSLLTSFSSLVLREGERVLLALLDDVAAVPAQVLDLGDRVARHAREALLRLELVVRERRHRRLAHLPGEEDDRVVAAGAPLRLLAADAVGHQLDGAPVERVVERREAVGRLLPSLEGVRVALLAVRSSRRASSRRGAPGRTSRPTRGRTACRRSCSRCAAAASRACGGPAITRRNAATAPPHWREQPEVQLVDRRAPVKDERDERDRDREDVGEVDRPVRERRALERHRDAGPMHRSASATIVMPGGLRVAGSGCSRASAAPCVNAKTRNGIAMSSPSTRCMSSIAMKNDEYFVNDDEVDRVRRHQAERARGGSCRAASARDEGRPLARTAPSFWVFMRRILNPEDSRVNVAPSSPASHSAASRIGLAGEASGGVGGVELFDHAVGGNICFGPEQGAPSITRRVAPPGSCLEEGRGRGWSADGERERAARRIADGVGIASRPHPPSKKNPRWVRTREPALWRSRLPPGGSEANPL